MVILVIFLILVFILYELYFYNLEKFSTNRESPYDHYFNGDVFMRDGTTNMSIGVGTRPNEDYFLDVNGRLTINGKLQLGTNIIDYDLAKKLNKLPLYTRKDYCLYEPNDKTKKQCISEKQLGMITGHTKVMFKNRYGETLSNFDLRHHGTHNRSESGRPEFNYSPFREGLNYKDIPFNWYQEPLAQRDTHSTLENSENSEPNDNNQFQLIPIENIDTNIYGDEANIKNIILFHPFKDQIIKHSGTGFTHTFGGHDLEKHVYNVLNKPNTLNNVEKAELKRRVDRDPKLTSNGVYLKLQKVSNLNKYYIRVRVGNTQKWRYLNVRNDNYILDGARLEEVLTKYPSGLSLFEINLFGPGKFELGENIGQNVSIKGSNGKFLCFGGWDDYIFTAMNRIRFLSNPFSEDINFFMYVEPSPDKTGEGEDDDTKKMGQYRCLYD